jgi:hypothetical protein
VISLRERAALHEAGEVVEVGRVTPRHCSEAGQSGARRHR